MPSLVMTLLKRTGARALVCLFCLLLAGGVFSLPALGAGNGGRSQALQAKNAPFPPLFKDKGLFLKAQEKAQDVPAHPGRVTGITLPHHLLAADLMAWGLAGLRGREYDRIILLSPDHFKRGKTVFAVPGRDFLTCLGKVPLDRAGAAALLGNPLVSESNLFSHEHGVQSLLPFLAAFFPDTPVLPVSLSISSQREEWDSLAKSLLPLLTDKTLILQSTDFSHYLSWPEAAAKDAETLRALLSGQEERILSLKQPWHLDSKAAQYLQVKLQRERFGAAPLVTANQNACEYLPQGEALPGKTTSYIVQVYSPKILPLPEELPGYVLAGDFFTGRYMANRLDTPGKRAAAAEKILAHTGGRPLILNFEGVLSPECPAGNAAGGSDSTVGQPAADSPALADSRAPDSEQPRLCMPEEATLDLLRRINCTAVSLANNHSGDFGPEAYARTKQALESQGIAVLENKTALPFPEFTLAAFTDVDNNSPKVNSLLRKEDFAFLTDAGRAGLGGEGPGGLSRKPDSANGAGLGGEGPGGLFRKTGNAGGTGLAGIRLVAAFAHCGREFKPEPGKRERYLAESLEAAGVTLFVGAHPHRAGRVEAGERGIRVWSLGNFLFDQTRNGADGAVLDLVFFPQGTWWVRQRAVGNLYKALGE